MSNEKETAKPQRYVSASELSVAFNVSLRTIAAWRSQGVPCINANSTGKRPTLRFSVNAVAEWLKAREGRVLTANEGEYSLTLRELSDLADWYANALALCRINPSSYKERFGDASTSDMVRLWLKNRGKEVKP